MNISTEKDFYESQELFSKWREKNFIGGQCHYQLYDHERSVLVEKWLLCGKEKNKISLIEIFPNGNGFLEYKEI